VRRGGLVVSEPGIGAFTCDALDER
jgi:hypothetical protein